MKASNAYRLKLGEPLPSEIAHVARGRIDHALGELRGKTDSTPEEAVHEARKDMKKLRALLRLARGELGKDTFARENACFRDAARELAGTRDSDVMLDTLASLDLPSGLGSELRELVQAHLARDGTRDRKAAAARAVAILDGGAQAGGRLAALTRLVRGRRQGSRADLQARAARLQGGARGTQRGGAPRVAQASQGPLVRAHAPARALATGHERRRRRGASS